MATSSIDRLAGVRTTVAIKAPVAAMTTANITLSGTQTIDDVAVVAGDRVLVKDQSTGTENGIYDAAASAWTRSKDFNSDNEITQGTILYVLAGTVGTNAQIRLDTASPVIGTSSLTFSTVSQTGLTDAQVKTAYENNADTNEFSDAEQTKLAGIETAADVTDVTNVTAAGAILVGDSPVWTGAHNFGGATSLEIPNSVAPTVDANGEIALDTTVTDFSAGLIKYFSTEEMVVVAMPLAEFTTPTNGAVPTYNSTNDEFEMAVPGGGGDALIANPLSQFAATTSAQLLGVIDDETGSNLLVFNTSPTLVTPVLGTPASGVATNLTGTAAGLTAGAVTTNANLTGHVTSTGNAAILGSFTLAQLNTAVSDGTLIEDVEGSAVLSTGEVGGTKFLREDGDGTSSWQTVVGSGDALVANPLSQFAATTSAQLLGVISNETGSDKLVFNTSPTLVTPVLGTPASGVATNLTGTAAGLTAGNVTTNANLTGHVTSVGNAAVLGSFTMAQLNTALSDVNVILVGDSPVWTGAHDFGGATSLEIPNSATPTLNADGEIALDSTVTDFTGGVLEYYSGEIFGVVAMPVAQFTTPTNGAVPTYNSTTDDFEMVVPAGSGDVSKVATPVDNEIGVWTGDGTLEGDTDFQWLGTYLEITGGILLNERADHAATPGAGKLEIWVSNDAAQKIMATDDTDADREILTGTAIADPGADGIMVWDDGDTAGTEAQWQAFGVGISTDGTTVSTEVSLTGSETLTNKTLTNPKASYTSNDAGTKSSGIFTPVYTDGNVQHAVNGGAHTLAPQSGDGSIIIQYTNTSAGIMTISHTVTKGDTLTIVEGDDFLLTSVVVNGFSVLTVQALQ